MKKITLSVAVLFMLAFSTTRSFGHCEMPCGIYSDQMRIDYIKESITTVEKAMKQITELQNEDPMNYNQIVRWTVTKEDHAQMIQDIVQQYFMTQRINPVDPSETVKYNKYVKELKLLHEMLIYAMKSKQTLDLEWIEKMRTTIDKFADSYFEGKEHDHKH